MARAGDEKPGGDAPPVDISERGALRRLAYRQVEDLLNSGRLKPGQLVSQRELVGLTGATLGSIREAIPKFEAEGLLVTMPQRGVMVPRLDATFVREAYQVRRIIECAAVPHAVAHFSSEEIDAMVSRFAALDRAAGDAGEEISADLLDRIQRADWDMHTDLVATMGNALLDNIYRVTAIKIRLAVQARLRVTHRNARRVLSEHRRVLAALATRDADETERALVSHIDRSMALALGHNL